MKPQPSRFKIVAVDGGAASGKSSTSRTVASRCNLMHVDTGSHYRVVTLLLLQAGVHPTQREALAETLRQIRLNTRVEGQSAHLIVNGKVPHDSDLRSHAVNELVSPVAAVPEVRRFLFDYQRSLEGVARSGNFAGMIMEGRDIGTVIFPHADLKIYLEADPETRSKRRAAEGGVDSVTKRDAIDSKRAAAPLACAPDAVRIDSSHLSLDQVVERISDLLARK